MSKDLLTKRLRTNAIIGTGSSPAKKIVVYSDTNAMDNNGGINSGLQTKLNNLSSDVFLYVDGIPGGKSSSTVNSTAQFGGDVVVTGKLYADTVYLTGTTNTDSLWTLSGSDLMMNNIYENTAGTGAFAIDLGTGGLDYSSQDITISDILNELQAMNSYTVTSKNEDFVHDTYFEFDSSGNVMPKSS
jgi:hypothetical protein